MNIDYIIREEIVPILDEECERLGIPKNFVSGVYGCYSNLDRRSYAQRIEDENGNTIKVRIRIGDSNKTVNQAKFDFYHEMWHAREYFLGENISEKNAWSYAGKRRIEEKIKGIKSYFNKTLSKVLEKI